MKKRRLLGIVLSLCMALMFVPQMVFAEDITPTIPPKDTDGVYQIGTEAELYWFAGLVNGTLTDGTEQNTTASAVLTADITVNSNLLNSLNEDGTVKDGATVTSWTPIGNTSNPYTGSFDGQGHTVSGLYFNDSNTSFVGLFGNLGSSGEIKNVGVIDSYFNGYLSVGGVCGKNTGIITSCYNTGEVSGKDSVGGVCGESFGTITGCYNTGEVSGNYSVGGVCGWNVGGTITGCYNTGTVSGTGNYVGGVCAYNTDDGYDTIGTITGSYNTGEVSGVESVGGVCGYEDKRCKIIGSYNTGTVSGVKYIGGVCGYEDNRCTIIGSYNTGTVSGTGNYVGGVCGFNFVSCIITGCYTNNGGVYGENNNGTVTDCDVMSDDEFADATVCKLLNTVLQNASSDVRFCQRIGKDASPLLTYQFDSIDDHTDDNPKDHICDICGERLSDHTGIDENPKDHLCDICAETLSNHTGGEATCTRKAICEYCKNEYGDLLDHDLENIPSKDATVNEEGNIEYWKCLDCGRLFADENGEKEISLEDTVIKKLTPETDGDKDQSTKADAEDSVKTGDDTNLVLWLALMLLSGAGITGVTAFARRKRTNE